MINFLPPNLKTRLTARAKNVLMKTRPMNPSLLLLALSKEQGALSKNILETNKVTSEFLLSKIPSIKKHVDDASGSSSSLNADIKIILKKAMQIASKHRHPYVGTEHLLYALILHSEKTKEGGTESVHKTLTETSIKRMKKHLDTIFSQSINFPNLPTIHKHSPTNTPALDAFCENLTSLQEESKLDPIIGRKKEISRMIHILSRRTKNNPLLIGEAGVGKTAIVQGLVQKIHEGEVPENLLYKKVYSLNLNSLIAGTMFRGDFEARMKNILKDASKKDTILFIDEIHTIVGAGSAQGSLDVANILKPHLSERRMQCIGATTPEEYRKYIEKERALERRFQTVIIAEETEEQSIKTLSGLKKSYEQHHGIIIDEAAIKSAVKLSHRYIRNRFLPDKALDVLDEAASKLRENTEAFTKRGKKIKVLEKKRALSAKQKEDAVSKEDYQDAVIFKKEEEILKQKIDRFKKNFSIPSEKLRLSKRHIEEMVSEISGVPVAVQQGKGEKGGLKKLAVSIKKEIIGQDEAIYKIMHTLKRSKVGLSRPERPLGSFLFLGQTGVGKTAVAYTLAKYSDMPLIKFDMADYAEPHTISRLIGSPPGYIGYEESGELTKKLRKDPYSIVLFDEIEKAHPQIHKTLLPILEEGMVTDATGESVSLRNTIIILTSNMSSDESIGKNTLGFSGKNNEETNLELESKYTKSAREILLPEIISRLDNIIVFKNLNRKDMHEISKIFLKELETRLNPIKLRASGEIIRHIARQAHQPGEGARRVRSAVEHLVERPIVEYLLEHNESKILKLELRKGKIIVR